MSQSSFEGPGQPAVPVSLSFFDRLTAVSFRIFKSTARGLSKSFPRLKQDLLRSDMSVTPEGLVSVALLLTVVSTIVVGVVATIVLILYAQFAVLLLFLLPLAVFGTVLFSPRFSALARGGRLDNELPFVVGFISILSGGGETFVEVLRRLSNLKIFPAASKESNRVLVDVDIYGSEPITALEKAAEHNPNKWYADLLSGYSTVLRTGGDHINYLNLKLKEVFEERAVKVKRAAEVTGAIAEVYLIVTVVLGITVFTLFLVQTLVAGSEEGLTNIFLFAFIIVPVISLVFIWVLDDTQPKYPFTDKRPYRVFAVTLAVGVVVFFVPLPIKTYLHLALALTVISAPPAFFATKYSRERRGIEGSLPDFIRDVAEGRKIGLPPEASVERLVGRDYGQLSKSVNSMGSQLSWGLSLKKVLSSFTSKVSSWVARAVATLMLEVVEVGGGTVKGFAEMADFTRRVSSMEKESRSSLRGYIFIAYLSGIMIIVSTYIFIYFLQQGQASGITGDVSVFQVSPEVVDLLFTATVFEGWVIGLVAGKMGESSVSEGFKHALIMVIFTLAAVGIGQTFFPIPL